MTGPLRTLRQTAAEVWRARTLVRTLVRREISARYAGSVGGIGWAYAQPLLLVAAYYLVFDIVFAMRLGPDAPTAKVGAFLIVGALPWSAFCDGLSRGMNSLLDSAGMLQKNALPPALFVVRAVLASAVVFAPLLLGMALAYTPSHGFALPVLALLPLVAAQIALTLVLGYLLAILAAAVRDTVQVIGFLLSVGIFASPVLFPVTMFPAAWRWVLWANPITPLVLGYQSILLQGAWPGWQTWAVLAAWLVGGGWLLAVAMHRSREQLVDWL